MGTLTNKQELLDYALLTRPELIALEMKFEGYNYKEIAKALEEEHLTIRKWFMSSGKLHAYYKQYAAEEAEARRKEATDTFKAHLGNAVRTLVDVMNKSKFDPARVNAAKEIINRHFGEPVKPVMNMDEDKVNDYMAAAKKLRDEEIQGNDGGGADARTA